MMMMMMMTMIMMMKQCNALGMHEAALSPLCCSSVSRGSTSCATSPIFKVLVVSNGWANSTVKKVGLTLLHHSSGHMQTTYAESVHNCS
jgi:hypothetical protein